MKVGLSDVSFKGWFTDFEKKTSYKHVHFLKKEALLRQDSKGNELRPALTIDNDPPFVPDADTDERFNLVKNELRQKLKIENCFPVFAKSVARIVFDEKVEEAECDLSDYEKAIPRGVGSAGCLRNSTDC